jgi:alpha-tubulin suppressor-like RCC1 family protein
VRISLVSLAQTLALLAIVGGTVGCRSRAIVEIAAGKDNTCLRTDNGRIYCFGDDAYMQTKDPSLGANPGKRNTPKRVTGLEGARSLALAASHGCAAMSQGGIQCFTDVDLEPVAISGFDARSVHAFLDGVCALGTNGELKCFKGEAREVPRKPVDVPGSIGKLTAVATGERHVCGINPDGTVTCFGDDQMGQVGSAINGKLEGLTGATAIAAGVAFTCARLNTGRVSCWGLNDLGQLGHAPKRPGENIDRVPSPVDGIEGAVAIAVGHFHACAVVSGGAVSCWGSNHRGELGRPATRAVSYKAERVPDIDGAVAVACGEWHSCALIRGGTVKCWGLNNRGQLGDGTNTDSIRPVAVKLP